MKTRITAESAIEQIEAEYKKKLQDASVRGVLLGGQTHARIALENWGNAYRAATSQDEKIRIADELVAYLERTAKGAEGKKDAE